ncbi:hypothetical protein GGR51DRAFT_560837 [Nemania sp. FL0031]|nr:hypothetical protein GGR51DRAFT_560837 [Nemania sp. FL0031]
MSSQKRIRTDSSEDEPAQKFKEYAVCDPCRQRKIRCGRERPSCSNCEKAGRDCCWFGNGKKPSQSIAFSNAIDTMGHRLQRLEQGMAKLQGSLDQILIGKSPTSSHGSWLQPLPNFDTTSLPLSTGWEELTGRSVGLGAFRAVSGSEMHAGPTSVHCLAIDAKELILEPAIHSGILNQHDAALLTDRLDNLSAPQQKNGQDSQGTEPLPGMPPMAMLETTIEPYFEFLNPSFPIWAYPRFRDEIKHHQKGNASYIVAANNIILLTLTAKFVRTMSRAEHGDSSEEMFPLMEVELIQPFVTNARRATEQMGRLSSPTLSNIQAILSLCLVSQYYLPEGTFYQLYHQAVYLARLIGLDGPMPLSGPSVSWATGTLAVNVMFDPTPTTIFWDPTSSDMQGLNWNSKLELSQIKELVFRHLAIPTTESKPRIEVLSRARELLAELEEWHCRYSSDISIEERREIAEEPRRLLQIDTVSYYFLRLMLLLAMRNNSKSSQEVVNASRDLIQAFVSQWRTVSDIGYYTDLTCNIALFTPIAMIQMIVAFEDPVTMNSNLTEDIELLRSFRHISHTVTRLSQVDSYAMRQATLIDILLDLASSCLPCPRKPSAQIDTGVQLDCDTESFSGSSSDTAINAADAHNELDSLFTCLQKPPNQVSYSSLPFIGCENSEVEQFGDRGIDNYQDIVDSTWWDANTTGKYY